MSAVMLVEFSNGNSLLIGGDDTTAGLDDVSAADDLIKTTEKQLKKAFSALPGLLGLIEESVSSCLKKPTEIECEFSASITADCKLWIVSGEAEGQFKVKLKWK